MTLFLMLLYVAWRDQFNKSNPGKESRRVGEAGPPVRGNRLVPSHISSIAARKADSRVNGPMTAA
jgi:hypothetical protein